MTKPRFTTILWDVDDTLLDFLKSEHHALFASFKTFNKEVNEEIYRTYSSINDSYWKRLERGEINRDQVVLGRFVDLFKEFSMNDIDPIEFQKVYQEELGSVFFYNDRAHELLKELKPQVRQYLVTNGNSRVQRKKLNLSKFLTLTNDVFISEEIGYDKPSLNYFACVFKKIPNFNTSETLIVGDSLTSDMLGGRNAGVNTCWYNPKAKPCEYPERCDYEIRNLWDIKKLL